MNKRHLAAELMLIFLASIFFANTVFANAAQPPCLTVIVVNAPDDLEVTFSLTDGTTVETKRLKIERRGWEKYFRLDTLYPYSYSAEMLRKATVRFDSAEYSFECALPDDAYSEYNNIVMLDREAQILKNGTYPGRYALIVLMRVLATLIIEGGLFLLFGYREKRSWLVFFILNLVTQTVLNIVLFGADYESYAPRLMYCLIEIFVFITEMLAFPVVLREKGGKRAVIYAFAANFISLSVGGLMLSYLPL